MVCAAALVTKSLEERPVSLDRLMLLTPDGGVHYGRVIAGLARSPGDLGALMEAGRDSSAAFATLKRAGRALAAL